MMFYHLADWPDAFEDLHQATRELAFRQIETLRKAGFDYLFYCVDATEWISPAFFLEWILEDTRRLFARWRELGGFVIWHSCGKVATFVERGFYNELAPEVLETLSEPPVGDLPSLRWARERLDRSIITKGNIGLDVLLQGSEEEVRREVRRVRDETAGYRHVVGLSDDILKNTPLRNARALVEESRSI
jgi:uroporphyrinogen-III decarboxylase